MPDWQRRDLRGMAFGLVGPILLALTLVVLFRGDDIRCSAGWKDYIMRFVWYGTGCELTAAEQHDKAMPPVGGR